MSVSALKTAVYRRLAGVEALTNEALAAQVGLAALLGVDPDTSLPAVYQGNKSVALVYPAICFRESGGVPDNRWDTDVGGIRVVILDMDLWSNSAAGNVISDIHNLLDQLLNERRGIAPPLTLTSGRVKNGEALTDLSVLYDRDTNAWYGYTRYQFILAHY